MKARREANDMRRSLEKESIKRTLYPSKSGPTILQIYLQVLQDERMRKEFVIDIRIFDMRKKNTVYKVQKSFTQLRVKARD